MTLQTPPQHRTVTLSTTTQTRLISIESQPKKIVVVVVVAIGVAVVVVHVVVATLGLHLGLSANLRIWQVSSCKMEPRSGMIMHLLTTHPPTQPPGASIFKY